MCRQRWSLGIALIALTGVMQLVAALSEHHDHQHHSGCGHKLVAEESRKWSQLHRQHKQHLQQQQQQQQQQQRSPQRSEGASSHSQSASPLVIGRELQQTNSSGTVGLVPIRIWVEYQGLGSLDANTTKQLKDTVNVALGVLKKYYKVKNPTPGRLLVPALCTTYDTAGNCYAHSPDFLAGSSNSANTCGASNINASHIGSYRQCTQFQQSCASYQGGTGEYTDYYLYITVLQDDHCKSGAVAWALPCLYDLDSNRPLLGAANLCPNMFTQTSQDAGVSVLVHELHHALGFTDDMFDKFVGSDGSPIPSSKVVKDAQDAFGRAYKLIISPTVAREAQAQFNCPGLPGAALENEGGTGSANAHWEYRLYQGELMVATNLFAVYGKPATLSRLTLAFMQDTGWYTINWEAAGFLNWGWQAGCSFAQGTCADYTTANPKQQYFCNQQDMSSTVDSVCTFDGLARAGCDTPQFADGCIMRVAMYNSPNCVFSQYRIPDGDKFGWVNGQGSRCSPVNYLFNNFAYQFPDASYKNGWSAAMCYQSKCSDKGVLQLSVLGNTLDCPTGTTIDLSQQMPKQFRQGTIGPCPNNTVICNTLSCNSSCDTGGVCSQGKCFCNLMYQGEQCQNRLTPSGAYEAYTPVGGDAAAGVADASSYLMMTAALTNTQDQLLLALDPYKSAVAQLAGVPRSRVAVLSYTVKTPSSLFGRRLASAGGSGSGSGSVVVVGGGGAALRHLQAAAPTLEVSSRIATMNDADAATITTRITNSTRQASFIKSMGDVGLVVVPDSIGVQQPNSNFFSPIANSLLQPQTRQILIIVGACLGGVLVLSILVFCIVRCVRRQLQPRPPMPPPPMFRPGNTYVGSPAGTMYGTMGPPGAAGAAPAGGYTVAGRTFRTRQEAEDYQMALAMQRSLQAPAPQSAWAPTSPQQRNAWSPTTTPPAWSPSGTQHMNGAMRTTQSPPGTGQNWSATQRAGYGAYGN